MGSYSLVTSYVGESILSGFDFFTAPDPSNGFVAYQGQANASNLGLYSVNELTQALTISVDTNTTLAANGSQGYRPSIRLESQATFNHGILIGDFEHMPGSICGSWPAFWVYGPNWPEGGEIDIIEGANTAQRNLMSGHTVMPTNGSDCTLPATGFTGSINNDHTDCTSPGNNGDVGCNFVPPVNDTDSYGDSFNAVGGGVYAMEWTSAFIKIWHWDRNSIPIDIIAENPDPSNWGEPEALFGGPTCDIDTFFYNMKVVLNMDLCGAYAGNVWGVTDDCTDLAPTCNEWVAEHPEALTDVYWEVNSIAIYQTNTAAASSTIAASASSSSAMPSAAASTAAASTTGSATLSTASSSAVESSPPGISAASSSATTSTSGALPSRSGSVSLSGMSMSSSSTTAISTAVSSVSSVPSASAGSSLATASSSNPNSSALSTSSSTVPAQSTSTNISPAHDPSNAEGYSFLGCFTSQSGFKTFVLQEMELKNTIEVCARLCRYYANSLFVGVMNQACYCARSLDPGTTALSQTGACNIPCPGNSTEYCGGRTGNGNSVTPRQALSDADLLTVYGDVAVIQPIVPPAPAMGANSSTASPPSAADVVTLTTTVTYTTVCATNPASLVVTEYCATLTATRCGCASEITPAVLCATVTQACDACGPRGESVVTLTVPQALVEPTGGAANTSAAGTAVVQVGGGTMADGELRVGMVLVNLWFLAALLL